MDQISYAIQSVKQSEYFVDESIEVGEQAEFQLNASLNIIIALGEIHFTISTNYRKKDTTEFLRGKTTSVFLIQNIKERVRMKDNKESVDLPDSLWVTLFSLSFTHARAMLAHSSAGTKYGHMILPLINPEQEFKKIFKVELESLV